MNDLPNITWDILCYNFFIIYLRVKYNYFYLLSLQLIHTFSLLKTLLFSLMLIYNFSVFDGIAGSYGDSVFHFLRNCQAVSTVATPFDIPTSRAHRFQFLHIFADTCYCLFLKIIPLCKWEQVSISWWFDLHFPTD